MTAVKAPLPGWAIHIWNAELGYYHFETRFGHFDPAMGGAELFQNYASAFLEAVMVQDETGFPIIDHTRGG